MKNHATLYRMGTDGHICPLGLKAGDPPQREGYDLLARRVLHYAHVYPVGEALAGILMIAVVLSWIAMPVALCIGTIGAVPVFKAVYID